MNKEQLIHEYAKCFKNTSYAIESYLETYDNTQSKYVPFKLFPEQKKMLNNFEKYNENITKKQTTKKAPPRGGVCGKEVGWLCAIGLKQVH